MDTNTEAIDFYLANRIQFIDQYEGKHLVIKGKAIIGIYNTNTEALEETMKLHEKETFIVEHPVKLKPKQVMVKK